MKKLLMSVLLVFWAVSAVAQVDTAWVRRYNGPGNGSDGASDIAVDASGNVYVTGGSHGSGTSSDYATIKYYASGDTAWVRRYNGPGNGSDGARDIAVDGSGNVYVTGSSFGSGTGDDYATIKYYPNGYMAWVTRYDGPNGEDCAVATAVDASGNVYVTGHSYGSGTYSDYATIKYYANGGTAWVRRYNGPGNQYDFAHAIAVDGSGNIYVSGMSQGSGTHYDYTTIKYYANGDTAWVRRYNGPAGSGDSAYDLAIDSSGDIYVTGFGHGSWGNLDYATVKYYANGDTAWVRRYNGPGNWYDFAYAIAVDGSANVYVTGHSWGSGTDYDYATIKYYASGDTAWVRRYNGPGNGDDRASTIAVDGSGNVYVNGYTWGSEADKDYTTVKYYPNGDTAWVRRYNGPGNGSDGAAAIVVDSLGYVYVTGGSLGSGTYGDYATIKYVQFQPDLIANLSAFPESGVVPCTVQFTDLSVGNPTSWLWDFGDDSTDTTQNPAHVYIDTGSFDVVLIVSNGLDFDTLIKLAYIHVFPPIVANFSGDPESGSVPLQVQFTDLSEGNPTSWLWDFGDGETDVVENPPHMYNDTGYFDVKLVALSHQDIDSLVREDYIHVLPSIPVLSWSAKPGYEIDGISPDTGLVGTVFTFRVVYTDDNNMPPQSGYPKVNIDLNGDGDFEDENEGSFSMGVVDVDTNYVNGREYFYNATLPVSSYCQYSFSAINSYEEEAVGEPTDLDEGPVILDPASALDLYIHASDITFSDQNPDEGETFTIYATIHNNSDSNLTNVSATFYHSEELLDQVLLSSVPSNGSATASTELSFESAGFYPIRAVVDEENHFQEWNELNNFAMRPVIVGDYEFPGEIVVQAGLNSPVYPHSWITVTGNAHYTPQELGPVSGAAVTVIIQETGVEYTTHTNDPGNFSIGFYGPGEVGSYSVIVEVTDYTLTDSTILNLDVVPYQSGVDLIIEISMSETDCLSEYQEVIVQAKVLNLGDQDAQDFWTCIYKDGSVYQCHWMDQLAAGDSFQIDTVISFSSTGRHTVTGIVDVGDSVIEYNEGNNQSAVSAYVACDDPDITITNVVFSDYTPKGDQPIDITAWVENWGALAVNETFGVEFSDNGIPFDTQYVTSLAPCGTQTAYVVSENFVYSDTMSHSFSIFADFENVIAECNEENNIYWAAFSAFPDLWPRNLKLSQDCFTWGDSLWFQVDIYNIGEETAESVWVRFLLDEDQVGEDVLIDSVPPGSGNYETRLSAEPWIVAEDLNATHVCRVVADPYYEILEIREDNNELTHSTPVVPCGDVNGDCIVNVGDVVLIINYLFKNGDEPFPYPAADVNADQIVDVGDVVYLINYLYRNGPAPECQTVLVSPSEKRPTRVQ